MTNHEAVPLHPFAGLTAALPEQDLEAVVGGQEKLTGKPPLGTEGNPTIPGFAGESGVPLPKKQQKQN